MKYRILVVDDDPSILTSTVRQLSNALFQVDGVESGEQALKFLAEYDVDLAVVDVMMPGIDGFELCRTIKVSEDIPIIMLTARDAIEDKAIAYKSGTDDYVSKPFSMDELKFRIEAVLRRYKYNVEEVTSLGVMTIHRLSYEIKVEERILILPKKEFELLLYLALNKPYVVKREQLIESIWGFDYEGDERTLDVHIKRLRNRFKQMDIPLGFQIKTVRGIGYQVIEDV